MKKTRRKERSKRLTIEKRIRALIGARVLVKFKKREWDWETYRLISYNADTKQVRLRGDHALDGGRSDESLVIVQSYFIANIGRRPEVEKMDKPKEEFLTVHEVWENLQEFELKPVYITWIDQTDKDARTVFIVESSNSEKVYLFALDENGQPETDSFEVALRTIRTVRLANVRFRAGDDIEEVESDDDEAEEREYIRALNASKTKRIDNEKITRFEGDGGYDYGAGYGWYGSTSRQQVKVRMA